MLLISYYFCKVLIVNVGSIICIINGTVKGINACIAIGINALYALALDDVTIDIVFILYYKNNIKFLNY